MCISNSLSGYDKLAYKLYVFAYILVLGYQITNPYLFFVANGLFNIYSFEYIHRGGITGLECAF